MSEKYRKFTFPKSQYRTRVKKDSNSKGRLVIGSKLAFDKLTELVGKQRADRMKKMHTRTLWVWGEVR